MKRFQYSVLILTLLLSVLLSACSLEQAPTLADGKRAVCQSLDALRQATTNLSTISPDTTVAEVREIRNNLNTLVEAARSANTVMQSQAITDMVEAYGNFSRTLDGLNPDQRVGDAATALSSSAANIVAALDRAYSSLSCAQ